MTAAGLRVVKIAESEKAIHVGFFLNGKSDAVFPGEERIIVPSPRDAAYYDAVPEMSVGRRWPTRSSDKCAPPGRD